jgi:FMN phosphatase YigB (HAD superfamily)
MVQITDVRKEYWESIHAMIQIESCKHFSFDFWNTIVVSNKEFKLRRAQLICESVKDIISVSEVIFAFEQIGREYNSIQESGEKVINSDRLLLQVLDFLHCDISIEFSELLAKIEYLFLECAPLLDDRLYSTLEEIAKRGKTCSITSNTAFISGVVIRQFLQKMNVLDYFAFCLFSDEVGSAKPNEVIFQVLIGNLRRIGVFINHDEIVHIGDNKTTDFLGAKDFGFKVFPFFGGVDLKYPRAALHCITSEEFIPFDVASYSKFKFGDSNISLTYGKELFEYFIQEFTMTFFLENREIVIYSSPYSIIPTASFFLTHSFYIEMCNYVKENELSEVVISLGKINRLQTYTSDYGGMNAEERYALIENDTYSFHDKPKDSQKLIFIDDISITGTHQRVVEKVLAQYNISSTPIFLYFAKLTNSEVSPRIENVLNYSYITSLNDLINLFEKKEFALNTRVIKYLLKLETEAFQSFIQYIVDSKKYDFGLKIVEMSILNGYNKLEELKENFCKLTALKESK